MITLFELMFLLGIGSSTLECGLPPLPPLGCSGVEPVCVCDGDGDCDWVFIGC